MDTRSTRSQHAKDYQELPQSIGVMVKRFEDGHVIPVHTHERDQLLYASNGLMRAKTETEAWVVPTDRAVYIPAGTAHSVSMHGEVEMCTLYISPHSFPELPIGVCVLHICGLLRELILALSTESIKFEPTDRAGIIARLIEIELGRSCEIALYIPLPQDPRLKRLCNAILDEPSSRRTLDGWADLVGGSTRTLARLFENELGMSFSNWRRRVRFYSALEALSLGEPVAVVAQNHGYRSVSAFSAAFRKTLGLRPSDLHDPHLKDKRNEFQGLCTR